MTPAEDLPLRKTQMLADLAIKTAANVLRFYAEFPPDQALIKTIAETEVARCQGNWIRSARLKDLEALKETLCEPE